MLHFIIYVLPGNFNFISGTIWFSPLKDMDLLTVSLVFLTLLVIVLLIWNTRLLKKQRLYGKRIQFFERSNQEQERKIVNQQKMIEEQLLVRDEQNELIHTQNIELEKHRHQLEKIVESRTNELMAAKEKAEESDRLKTSFLENISHEIRTPMNAIVGFSSLLEDLSLSTERRSMYIRRIQQNTKSLLKLIENILDMSKIQEGQMEFTKTRFSVKEALAKLYQEFKRSRTDSELTKISFELGFDESDKDYFIYNDLQRFTQIVGNLLSNAFKFTETGIVRMGFNPSFASEFNNEPESIRFFVEDSGIGIPPGKSESIFELFTKIEDNRSKLYRGTGLGLYLSKHLVEMMGGKIWEHSNPSEGSTFYFTLPYFNTEDRKKPGLKTRQYRNKKVEKDFDWRNKTILIVEDEQHNYALLSEIIRKTGALTLEAKNGMEAVEAVRSNPAINLVLMDIMMPEMDGYEATREIKKLRPGLPVFAQTAYTEPRQKEKSLEAGCEGYILKPYNPPELLTLLDNFI